MPWDVGAIEAMSSTSPPTQSTKFKVNDRVSVRNGPANVRKTAGGLLVGQQQNDAQGTITAGPIAAAIADSTDPTIYNWWSVNFDLDSSVDGWVGEGTLTLATVTPPIPIPPTPTPATMELSVDGVFQVSGPADKPLVYKINTNRKTKTITVVTK